MSFGRATLAERDIRLRRVERKRGATAPPVDISTAADSGCSAGLTESKGFVPSFTESNGFVCDISIILF